MGLVIGLDIDGVVANSFPVFVKELNKHYKKNITMIDNCDITKVYGVDEEDLSCFFDANVEYLFGAPEPVPGALETINYWLKSNYDLVFVTARRTGREEKTTLKWFEKYNLPKDKIIFTGGLSKAFAVKEYGIDIFVDDFLSNASEIAAIGVPVLLLDAPYNQGKLPEGVTRCYGWEEIYYQIRKFAQKHQNYKSYNPNNNANIESL